MNILILRCGSRSHILSMIRSAVGAGGQLVAGDTDPWASALYEADKWYLLPPAPESGYMDRVLDICRAASISCIVPLAAPDSAVLSENRDRFTQEGISLVGSEEDLRTIFGAEAMTSLLPAYRDCFTEPKPTLAAYGRRVYKAISRRLPPKFKTWLWLLPHRMTTYRENKRIIRTEPRRIVYLLDTPRHDNLGDHAIAHAQKRFLEKALPDARILEIPIELVEMHLGFIRRHIRPEDLFCMIGGGNFGDEYLMHEHSKRKVCAMFPENRVIVFPQTISYSDTPRGHRELELTQEVLGRHEKLTITARDRISHRRAQTWFPNADCILTPDIVLSLDPVAEDVTRRGILCCLRRDLERNAALPAGDVLTRLAAGGYRFTLSDTLSSTRVSPGERSGALRAKWREFCGAELVITDRLHGMIFSCITSTPCIVIDNYNHKIRNFYQTWLEDVPHIRFAENVEDILPLTQALLAQGGTPWDPAKLAAAYSPLLDALGKDLAK